jgi:ubiquinone/menaquinone biosynthesis C-methylase UbiE
VGRATSLGGAAGEGAHATGIDPNEDHLTVAAELAREAGLKTAQFRSANIFELGLEPESVDVSYSRWLMVHLNRPVDAMRTIHAALKPGGVTAFGTYCSNAKTRLQSFFILITFHPFDLASS